MADFPDLLRSSMFDDVGKITAEISKTIFEINYGSIGSNTQQRMSEIIS